LLSISIDLNNILARAVAGIPLDSEACPPNRSATEPKMDIVIPSSTPTQTVTLEICEEFHWRGWKHGAQRERVTFTRSFGDSVLSMTSNASGISYLSSLARIADHGTLLSSCDDLTDRFEQRNHSITEAERDCGRVIPTPSTS